MIEVTLVQNNFNQIFIQSLLDNIKLIFATDNYSVDVLRWRLENMPDVGVFVAKIEDNIIGFKAGYATSHKLYYSWLGGVQPQYRGRSVVKLLMQAQHQWLQTATYQTVETYVQQNNQAMIQLNLNSGLTITGMFVKERSPYYIMQRACC